jgi:hypothetical protein
MLEADPKQTIQHFAREFRSVPDVGNLEARHQRERVGLVRTRIAGDRRFRVTIRTLLHVRRLCRAMAVQLRPIAPFGIELDAIWGVCDHQSGQRFPQQPCDHFRVRGIPA